MEATEANEYIDSTHMVIVKNEETVSSQPNPVIVIVDLFTTSSLTQVTKLWTIT